MHARAHLYDDLLQYHGETVAHYKEMLRSGKNEKYETLTDADTAKYEQRVEFYTELIERVQTDKHNALDHYPDMVNETQRIRDEKSKKYVAEFCPNEIDILIMLESISHLKFLTSQFVYPIEMPLHVNHTIREARMLRDQYIHLWNQICGKDSWKRDGFSQEEMFARQTRNRFRFEHILNILHCVAAPLWMDVYYRVVRTRSVYHAESYVGRWTDHEALIRQEIIRSIESLLRSCGIYQCVLSGRDLRNPRIWNGERNQYLLEPYIDTPITSNGGSIDGLAINLRLCLVNDVEDYRDYQLATFFGARLMN